MSTERSHGERVRRGSAREPVQPIYRRLPRGPHGLDARQIAVHQRARLQGALVEAIARGGYDALTVRALIGLAGVSRRSFYEHFENRYDCFLQTAAALSRRELAAAHKAALASEARRPGSATEAALASLLGWCERSPSAARVALCETLAAGDQGAALLLESLGAAEKLMASALAAERPLPAPVIRAAVGAVHGCLTATLEGGPAPEPASIAQLALSLRLPTDHAEEFACVLRERARRAAIAAERRQPCPPDRGPARERLLASALRVAARQPVRHLNAAEIADDAGVAVAELLDLFDGPRECLEAALREAGDELLSIAARAGAVAGEPAEARRLALAGILVHFAQAPAEARGLALLAHRAGPVAAARRAELDRLLGAALTIRGPQGEVPAAAATGALWHLVRQALLSGRARVLPALSDHLAYALLAPALGAEPAIEALGGGAGRG